LIEQQRLLKEDLSDEDAYNNRDLMSVDSDNESNEGDSDIEM